jgi:hypothetical protein
LFWKPALLCILGKSTNSRIAQSEIDQWQRRKAETEVKMRLFGTIFWHLALFFFCTTLVNCCFIAYKPLALLKSDDFFSLTGSEQNQLEGLDG